MTNSTYAAFVALDPFFDIVMQGLAGATRKIPIVMAETGDPIATVFCAQSLPFLQN